MHRLIFMLLVLATCLRANDNTVTKVGDVSITIPDPDGMVQIPDEPSYHAAFTGEIPAGAIALKECLPTAMFDGQSPDKSGMWTLASVYVPQEFLGKTVNDEQFQAFVAAVKERFTPNAIFRDEDAQKHAKPAASVETCIGVIDEGPKHVTVLLSRIINLRGPSGNVPADSYHTLTYLNLKGMILQIHMVRARRILTGDDRDYLQTTTSKLVAKILALNGG